MEPELTKETEAARDKAEATRQELEDLRQKLCKEFTARVPSTTDAAMHVLYLDKALQDIKEAYKDRLTWELEDYRQFYEALQQSKVYRTENPQHWWGWSKWFQSQSKTAQVELLKQAGLFALQKGLLVAAIGGAFSLGHWFLGRSERKTQAIYQDWQVINSAQGKPGSGGRVQAIQNLYHQGESLVGLSASKGAYLQGLNLASHKKQLWNPFDRNRKADLSGANLDSANLERANLSEAHLQNANLQNANLSGANLSGANLYKANLDGAYISDVDFHGATLSEAHLHGAELHGDLHGANLDHANLDGANLQNANLSGANLSGTYLHGANLDGANLLGTYLYEANLSEANLHGANLHGTDLQNAHLSGANLSEANLHGANLDHAHLDGATLLATDLRDTKNFDSTQLKGKEQPLLCNVALPESVKDKDMLKDRDCERMPQELLKRYPQDFYGLERVKSYVDEARQKKWE